MNDYSKTYFHLDKSESLIAKKRMNTENQTEIKLEKYKKVPKIKDNLSIKHRLLKKMSQQNTLKNQYIKKISNSNFIKDKYKSETKKLTHNKSYNIRRNKQNERDIKKSNNNISKEKILKKINNQSFFDVYEKNNIKRRHNININIRNKENNNSNINFEKTYANYTSQVKDKKFSNSYFKSLHNKDKKDDYFSRSQNFGNKKNILRRINTNLSMNKDKYNKTNFNFDNDFNKSQTNFYKNKILSKDFFRSNYLYNNRVVTEINDNTEDNNNNSNNFNSITKYDNSTPINTRKPIKLYQDKTSDNKNNTTINLPGSYNFHQYFNTIINKNNKNHERNNNNNMINFNNNLASIESNKIYNNSQYCQTQIYNTNESDNKSTTLTINDSKLIDEVNDIQNELENKLKQNVTNSKSKKYNILKHAFENLLKSLNLYVFNNEINPIFILLQKLLIGYHDVVGAFSSENRKLKELNYKLTEQYQKIDKNFIECNKTIKEKQNEIQILGNKISFLVNELNDYRKINIILKNKFDEMNMNKMTMIKNLEKNSLNENNEIKNNYDKEKSTQFNKITNINMNNLDDLDSLYFFDKIEMRPQRSYSCGKVIPFLPIHKIFK